MAWVHKNRPGIPRLKAIARTFDGRAAQPEQRWQNPVYSSGPYRAWARFVVARAGRRCEAIDDGKRCRKAAPEHRLYADHIVELQDGGLPFDPANGQALCSSHHEIKTMRERAKRLGSSSK